MRTVEYMRPEELTLVEDAFYVDGGLTYTGAPATVFSGLSHLERKQVSVLADGLEVTGKTVTGGSITLSTPASKVHIGLPYTSELITMPVEPSIQQQANIIQGHNYQVINCIVRMLQTGYAEISTDEHPYTRIPLTRGYDPSVASVLFSGDKEVQPRSSMNKATQIKIRTDKPLPCGITNIISKINVGDA